MEISCELNQCNRFDIECSLVALLSELTNLERLTKRLDGEDVDVLKQCSIKINQLILKRLTN